MIYILHFFRFFNFLIPVLCSISSPDPGTDFPSSLRVGHFLTRWCNFWQSVCIERTGEQTVLTGLPGDREDRFNPTISFLWSHQVLLPLLFSLGLIIVMLSLLSLFRFSLIKFKEWSTAQLASCASSGIYPLHSFALRSPLATNLKLDSINKKFSYASTWSLVQLLHSSQSCFISRCLRSASDIPCSEDRQEDTGGEILSVHQTCGLGFSCSLCEAFFFTLYLKKKKKRERKKKKKWLLAF